MWTIIIGAVIVLYSLWVIRGEIRKRKNGRGCSGCSGCSCGSCHGGGCKTASDE